ncbi:MAG TPA: multidrug effflux MFS transporter [Parafilimonas sp.]|nr:multidrug effflux MFS transporter [Parafilimonas sp.]
MKGKQKFFTILVLGLLSAIGPFSIDMYLPGFPAIAAALHTTVPQVALSLSSFFIGISFGQFLYGPLLDRFGRRPPLYAGISLYFLASLWCVFATSVHMLIVLRLFQGLGGCVGMVAARAYVRDIFPVHEIAKIFSLLMLVIAVSPIVAPTSGGYVTAHLGWQYIFVVLTVFSALILALMHFVLPAGRPADKSLSLKPKPIVRSFLAVFKNPQFLTYALTGSIAASGLYAYVSGSAYVFMQLYKVTEQQFGWIFAIIAAGLIASSQVNSLLLRNFESSEIIRVALLCQAITGIILLLGAVFNIWNVYAMIIGIFIFLCCQGFTFPNASALCLAPFSKNAGTASALMGGIQMITGTLSSALVSVLANGTSLPMTAVMGGCSLSAFLILMIGQKKIGYRTELKEVEEKEFVY